MQIHQLRYFCAIARTGNFTRAAQHEHIAQPSLSQQIRKLEDELGTRLFDRLGRSVRLTQMGEAFLPRAEAILRQVGAAKLEIQEMAGTEQGKLVIGAIPTIAPYSVTAGKLRPTISSCSGQHSGGSNQRVAQSNPSGLRRPCPSRAAGSCNPLSIS